LDIITLQEVEQLLMERIMKETKYIVAAYDAKDCCAVLIHQDSKYKAVKPDETMPIPGGEPKKWKRGNIYNLFKRNFVGVDVSYEGSPPIHIVSIHLHSTVRKGGVKLMKEFAAGFVQQLGETTTAAGWLIGGDFNLDLEVGQPFPGAMESFEFRTMCPELFTCQHQTGTEHIFDGVLARGWGSSLSLEAPMRREVDGLMPKYLGEGTRFTYDEEDNLFHDGEPFLNCKSSDGMSDHMLCKADFDLKEIPAAVALLPKAVKPDDVKVEEKKEKKAEGKEEVKKATEETTESKGVKRKEMEEAKEKESKQEIIEVVGKNDDAPSTPVIAVSEQKRDARCCSFGGWF